MLGLRKSFEGLTILDHTSSGYFHCAIMEGLAARDLKPPINDLGRENISARPTEFGDSLIWQRYHEALSGFSN